MSDCDACSCVGRVTIESMRLALKAEHLAAEFSSEIRALLLLATAARVVFFARNQSLGFGIEPAEVARSLVSGRGFTMSGVPSAHSAPLLPFIMAGFLKLFGDGPAFSYSMIGLQILVEWAAILILPVVAKRLVDSLFVGYCAAAVLIASNVMFLGWETSPSVLMLEMAALGDASPLLGAGLIGIGMLLSPVLGLAILLIHFRWNRAFAISAVGAALLCSPWIIRNYLVFHRFIPIRDNLGLELRLSHNPHATVSMADNQMSFMTYDPIAVQGLRKDLTRIGEPAVYEGLGQDAARWIRSNPLTSLKLTFERFVAYWLPWDHPLSAVLTVFSFWGIWLSRRNARVMRLVWVLLVVFPMPYYLIQHSLRYRAPTFWFTAVLACILVSKALDFSGRRIAATYTEEAPVRNW
jgi:hypothetical protein